ncbi:MAG: hypothetical protein R2748_23280 [Bryobacterales bacterium]
MKWRQTLHGEDALVAEAGPYVLKMRARTKDAVPKLQWSTVDNMRAHGNEKTLELKPDGSWQNLEIPFRSQQTGSAG